MSELYRSSSCMILFCTLALKHCVTLLLARILRVDEPAIFYSYLMKRARDRHAHGHTHTRTHAPTRIRARCSRTQFIISSTVTGETFRGKERGALNNECEEPCYTADKPLKWHNLLPPLPEPHQCADTKTEIKGRQGRGATDEKQGGWKHFKQLHFSLNTWQLVAQDVWLGFVGKIWKSAENWGFPQALNNGIVNVPGVWPQPVVFPDKLYRIILALSESKGFLYKENSSRLLL